MNAIYGDRGIKAGYEKEAAESVQLAVNQLLDHGVQAIGIGCTEISLILGFLNISVPLVNPTRILALKSIEIAGGKLRL